MAMTLIDSLMVAVRISVDGAKQAVLSLGEVEAKFFKVAKSANVADSAINKVGKNASLRAQTGNALQLLSQVNHTNNALHAMHAILTKIGGTGPLIAGIGAAFAGIASYRLSEKIAELEKLSVQQDFLFSDTPTGGTGMRERASEQAQKFGMSINDLTDAVTSFKLQSININEKFLPAMMAGAEAQGRTLKSVALMVDDALSGQGRRLKEYGITQKTTDTGYTFRKHGMKEETFGKEDREGIIDYLGRAFEQQYGGLARATAETTSAEMQRVKNALAEDTTSVWKTFARGAVDPIYEAWHALSVDIVAWTKDPAVQEALFNIGRAIGEAILLVARLTQSIGVVIDKLMPAFDFIMTALGVVFDVFEAGVNTLNEALTGGFTAAAEAWKEWSEVIWLGLQLLGFKFANSVLDLVDEFVPGIDEARAALTDFFMWFDEKWTEANRWIDNFLANIKLAIMNVELAIIDGVEEAFTTALDWLKDKVNFFSSSVPVMTGGRGGGVVNNTNVNASYSINTPNVEAGMASARINTSYLYG